MASKAVQTAARKNSGPSPAAVVAIVGITAVAAPVLVFTPVLAAFGFGASGIVGGSIAAAAQSAMGSVAAGSLFATLQSAAMGGAGATIVAGATQVAGAAALTGVVAGKMMNEGDGESESESEEEDVGR
ncbi:hypothetical protein QBC35DRAFT_496690 [Podospora australis]|uniref:Uncharacterized protein n=1 Tax=Podospora australis TaxID=1536484 RepID=A0AAN6WUJ7_9PEZI|nr:hypothetical protein QBC35DRAFT_496690 [Podospora australis]